MPPHVTEPSTRARELVRGAYDLHVHVEPDFATRRIDDLSLARRFSELGLSGFVLKSHYARIVSLPTVDAENEASEDGPKPAKQPVWRVIQNELAAAGVARAPVRVTDEGLDDVLAVAGATTSRSPRVTWGVPRSWPRSRRRSRQAVPRDRDPSRLPDTGRPDRRAA